MSKEKIDKEKSELKEIRKKLEAQIEDSLPEEFRNRLESKPAEEESPIENLREVDAILAKRIIEALLFSASRSVKIDEIKKILRGYKAPQIQAILKELQDDYVREGRSFRINEIAEGWEMTTEPEFHKWIQKSEVQKKPKMASAAALETLAVIAYKQPVTRAEIETLRGVDSSGVLAVLLERELVKIVGRKEVPGRPLLYSTTPNFLEHFGMKALDDLPRINEIREIVQASIRKEELMEKANQDKVQKEREAEKDKVNQEQEHFEKEQEEVREKYREIADNIEGVKVLREKELNKIIHPEPPEEEKEEAPEGENENPEGESENPVEEESNGS